VPSANELGDWLIKPKPEYEKRVAMVFIFSDYSTSEGIPALPGARNDALRVAAALEKAGFETQTVLNPKREVFQKILQEFEAHSATADIAVIYATGHGVEVNGKVYLIPNDYPVSKRNTALASKAILLARLSASAKAKKANLIFYGGCRNNPFGKSE
jgi:uncharacterized caspase-like protein